MSISNGQYLWDDYSQREMSLSLEQSPSFHEHQLCASKGCGNRVTPWRWNQGNRFCVCCAEKVSLKQQLAAEQSSQSSQSSQEK